jgi:hypothetical protein
MEEKCLDRKEHKATVRVDHKRVKIHFEHNAKRDRMSTAVVPLSCFSRIAVVQESG